MFFNHYFCASLDKQRFFQKGSIHKGKNFLLKYKFFPLRVDPVYRIYLAMRWGFRLSRMTKITRSVLWNSAVIGVLLFLKDTKELDLSYKTDLDFGIVLEGEKTLS